MEDWLEAQRRQDAERKAKRERDDLEYEKDRAQEDAQRAERAAREARESARRERAAAAEELEYAREAELSAAADAREMERRAAKLEELLVAVVAAWDSVIPLYDNTGGEGVLTMGEAIGAARAFLNPIPADPE